MSKQIKSVFQTIEREGQKTLWNRIGTAFVNRDGSLNVMLHAVPIDGRLHIRDQREPERE